MKPGEHRESTEQGGRHARNSHGNGLRLSTQTFRHHEKGILLFECLVYFSIWLLVMGLAFAAFYRCVDYSKALSRNAADIVHVLQAGERWRDDVREATGPLERFDLEDNMALHIPHTTGETIYLFMKDGIWRSTDESAPWMKILSGVRTSRVLKDERGRVVTWRWEVELKNVRKAARFRPLFSFQAVTSNDAKK
jgi:hypothetical protein